MSWLLCLRIFMCLKLLSALASGFWGCNCGFGFLQKETIMHTPRPWMVSGSHQRIPFKSELLILSRILIQRYLMHT